MGASDRRKLWICRFAWTTQTRCPHTHSSDRKKRRKRLEDSFEEEENRNGRRLYTLIPKAPGPTDGVHLKHGRRSPLRARPPARQQIQREHQNPPEISELEYPVPPRNPADELTVNLDSVPCGGEWREIQSRSSVVSKT